MMMRLLIEMYEDRIDKWRESVRVRAFQSEWVYIVRSHSILINKRSVKKINLAIHTLTTHTYSTVPWKKRSTVAAKKFTINTFSSRICIAFPSISSSLCERVSRNDENAEVFFLHSILANTQQSHYIYSHFSRMQIPSSFKILFSGNGGEVFFCDDVARICAEEPATGSNAKDWDCEENSYAHTWNRNVVEYFFCFSSDIRGSRGWSGVEYANKFNSRINWIYRKRAHDFIVYHI